MPTVKIRDLNVRYEDIGTGRPLLGIHGFPGNGRMVMGDFDPLLKARPGWRQIYPDLLDYGDVPPPDWMQGPDSIVDILVEFMDAVAPGQHFTIAGFSWGAYIARGVIHRRLQQVDGVLLGCPLMAYGLTQPDLPARQVIHVDSEFTAALQPSEEWMSKVFVASSLTALDALRSSFLAYWTEPNPSIEARIEKPFSFDPDTLAAPCPAPALFVVGRQDHIVGYKRLWSILDNFPRATLAVLDRAGHLFGGEQPVLWQTLLNEWLDRVEEYIAATHPAS